MTRHAHPRLGAFLAAALLPCGLVVGFFAPSPYPSMASALFVGPFVLFGATTWRSTSTDALILVGAVWLWTSAALSAALLQVLPPPLAIAPYALVLVSLLFPKALGFHRFGRWGTWPLALMGPPLDPKDLALVMFDRLLALQPELRQQLFEPPHPGSRAPSPGEEHSWRVWFRIDRFGCPTEVQWHIWDVPVYADKATTGWLVALGPRRLLLDDARRDAGAFHQDIVVPASLGGLRSAHQRMAFAERLLEAQHRLQAQGFDPRHTTWATAPTSP